MSVMRSINNDPAVAAADLEVNHCGTLQVAEQIPGRVGETAINVDDRRLRHPVAPSSRAAKSKV
jgi:hypothetical protein